MEYTYVMPSSCTGDSKDPAYVFSKRYSQSPCLKIHFGECLALVSILSEYKPSLGLDSKAVLVEDLSTVSKLAGFSSFNATRFSECVLYTDSELSKLAEVEETK